MKTLTVALASRTYPIYIGVDLLHRTSLFAPHVQNSSAIALVTNTTVAPLYAQELRNTLAPLGKPVFTIVLPDGEAWKRWETLDPVFEQLLAAHADRTTTLIALGGGVVGDMTGFAAACYMRGIPFIQVPTTLLAQVDSSVGGKTGINHVRGKNMIGAFHQPQAVIADVSLLRTLPLREQAAGLAEIIKIGAVADAAFFDWVESHIASLNAGDQATLIEAIYQSCALKAQIVADDECELDKRAMLNFGHTFGHAIEAGLGYGEWLHGEAVGCGMVMAADLSVRLGFLDESTCTRITRLVKSARLPVYAPALGVDRYIALMCADKKAQAGIMRFVLLSGLGNAQVIPVEDDTVLRTVLAERQVPTATCHH